MENLINNSGDIFEQVLALPVIPVNYIYLYENKKINGS